MKIPLSPFVCFLRFLILLGLSVLTMGRVARADDAPAPASAPPTSVTVGDPQNPDGLEQALNDAYKTGVQHIIITPGTYLIPSTKKIHLHLQGWNNVVISAPNVTLVLDHPDFNDKLFVLEGCQFVTLEDVSMTENVVTAYQGHVTSIGKQGNGDYTFDWSPSPGYPTPADDEKKFWVDLADAQSHELVKGEYNDEDQKISDGVYRYHVGHDQPGCQVGDYLVARYDAPPTKVLLSNCFDCTIKNITMTRNGFAPIFESAGGGNHILGCKWLLGPRPDGANEDPIVSTAADGIHCANSNPGPDIENCDFEGDFLDDCIAVHGSYQRISSVNGNNLTVGHGYADFRVNEPARISDDKGFYLEALVTAIRESGDNTIITIDSKVSVPFGCAASNPRADGQGYRIIGNKLGHTRSRGIIAKADNGLIKDNIIDWCSLPIRLGGEWPAEADYANNVVVEGNTFDNNCYASGGYIFACVTADGNGEKENTHIVIRNNHFNSNYSGEVGLYWTDNAVVTGNTFVSPTAWPHNKPKAAIYVSHSANIDIHGNQIDPANTYSQPWIKVGDDVTNLSTDVHF